MKLSFRKQRRAEFRSIDGKDRERMRLWQALVRFLFQGPRKKKRAAASLVHNASPDTTAVMSDEDFASQSSQLAESDNSSGYAVAPDTSNVMYYAPPTFGDARQDNYDDGGDNDDSSEGKDVKLRLRWRERVSRSWKRLLIGRQEDFLLGLDSNHSGEEDNAELDRWEHFSISTKLGPRTFPKHSSRSFRTKSGQSEANLKSEDRDDDDADREDNDDDDKTRISLREFFEIGDNAYASMYYPSEVRLGDISAQDSRSVGSALLAVSYDDDCAQLVLKTSASSESDEDVLLNEIPLGALYPHPAGNSMSSVSTLSKQKTDTACVSAWINQKVDKLWQELDGDSLDDSFDEDRTATASVQIETKSTNWESDSLGWSFSQDDSVVSFSSMLGDNLFKPICHMAAEIPALPQICGVNQQRLSDDSTMDHDSSEPSFRRPYQPRVAFDPPE